MEEQGTWMINYKTFSYEDSDPDLDEYVDMEFSFLTFPDGCWDQIVLVVESAGMTDKIYLQNKNTCYGSLVFEP